MGHTIEANIRTNTGEARIFKGGMAREQSYRAGEDVGGGIPSPSHGEIFEKQIMKVAFSEHKFCSGVIYA